MRIAICNTDSLVHRPSTIWSNAQCGPLEASAISVGQADWVGVSDREVCPTCFPDLADQLEERGETLLEFWTYE